MPPEYLIWWAMNQRCHDPRNSQYADYGGRGITVCLEWRASWHNFVRDVGKRPDPKFVLDRIDNNKGYEPGNVRWVTRRQSAENRRCTIRVTFDGLTLTLADWARAAQLDSGTLYNRVKRGWDFGRAIALRPLPRGRYTRAST